MLKQEFTLIIWMLCALQCALSRPTKENARNATNASLISTSPAASVKPDVELINFGGVIRPDEDDYRRAAASNGMDPAIVAEVIRNGKPVVKTEFDNNGAKRTTTYKLETDGSISRHTLTEYSPSLEKVHKSTTFSTSPQAKAESKIEKDWEWNPTDVPKFGTPTRHTFDFPQYTPTWTTPVFTNGNPFASRPFKPANPSEDDDTTTIQLPNSWNTQSWPNTNTFEHVDPTNSGTVTKTVINDDGTKVTTTHTVGPTKWTTRTFTYPAVHTNFPKFDVKTTTPFPSLQDFLNSQYGTTTKNPFSSTIPNLVPGSTPVTTISVDDLPTVKVPINELKPEDSLTPTVQTTKTYTKTIQTNGNPTAADLDPKMREILNNAGISPEELFNSKNGTITKTRQEPDGRTVTTTYRVRTVPTNNDDDGDGNLSPSFAKPTFTSTFDLDQPRGPFFIVEPTTPPSHISASHGGALFPTLNAAEPSHEQIPTNWRSSVFEHEPKPEKKPASPPFTTTTKNPIEEFLSKVDLSPDVIEASNGEVIKTIVDDKGRVLTARFVLSTVKNNEKYSQDISKQTPIK